MKKNHLFISYAIAYHKLEYKAVVFPLEKLSELAIENITTYPYEAIGN